MLGSEYDYLAGGVLLGVSGRLAPEEAETLKATLAGVLKQAVTGPVEP
jgi:hypothetical protein